MLGIHHHRISLSLRRCYQPLIYRARNIDLIFDTSMTIEHHITAACKSAVVHLRNISRTLKYMSLESAEILVHLFVTSRLDFCNSLLTI